MKKVLLCLITISLLASPLVAQEKTLSSPPNTEAKKLKPADVLDLSGWKISLPIDTSGKGKATEVDENTIAAGYELPKFFYANEAGDGVVFSSPIKGALTSKNTTYTRTELREMGRRGDTSITSYGPGKTINKNNWVLSTSPKEDQLKAFAVDGTLDAVLTVDEVTTTGKTWQQGRVIVGQIHANDDEPAKLYYRKFPNHERGSVFLAHEPVGKDDQLFPLIGSHIPDYNAQDGKIAEPKIAEPKDGIKLGEKWGYQIKVVGNKLTVTIRRTGKKDVVQVVDMSKSKYDAGGQYMFFKAGVYNQNKTGKADERTTATFYELKVTHE